MAVEGAHIRLTVEGTMAEEPGKTRLPKLPETQASAKAVRSVTKAAVGSVPFAGAVLSEVVENVMPDPDKIEDRRWAGEVNECLDGLHTRIDGIEDRLTGERTVSLEGTAADMLRMMLTQCPDGQCDELWDMGRFRDELPEVSEQEIKDAAGELQHHGLVEPLPAIGAPFRIRLSPEAYVAADKSVMGWDPREDAKHLARLVLQQEGGVSTSELHAASTWPLRRFNPALGIVLQHVSDGPISQELTPDYPTRHFSPTSADRFALKCLANE